MKITKTLVREFESQQRDYGTETAIHNLIWQIASSLLKDIGVKHIKTS